ncbi:MAG: S9 family peptidase [Sphingobacteriales bacterium]|nr:S9 family peptidase [Sphingobacteriales bacterium]
MQYLTTCQHQTQWAEYLIKNKYTQSSKLACFSGSAGGTLIGRAITERPELFAAATIQSGTVNLIRSKAWPNLISNYPEFGNPEIESEMKGLIEADALIHVKPNTKSCIFCKNQGRQLHASQQHLANPFYSIPLAGGSQLQQRTKEN